LAKIIIYRCLEMAKELNCMNYGPINH